MDKRMGIIMVMLMTNFLGFGIIIPVLPELILQGGSERFHLYVMLAVYSATSFFMSPLWGAWSDRIGRKPIMMMGVLGFSLSFFLFGISGSNLVLMYIARILGGIFSGATTSCAVAYVADITSAEQRTRSMGLVGMSIGIGFIFGPAIGGLLSAYGLAVPFFAAAGLAFLNFLIASFLLQESLPQESRRKADEPKVSRWSAWNGPITYMFVLMFLLTFTLAGVESTLQYLQIEQYQATPQDIGIIFLVSGIVGALVQGGFIRKYAKQGREPMLIRTGLVLQAIGFVLLLFSRDVWTASIYMSIFGVGNSLLRPCVTSMITQTTKVGQGVTNGLSSAMESLGRVAGPLIAGGLFEIKSALPYLTGALISLGAILLLNRFLTAVRKEKLGGTAA